MKKNNLFKSLGLLILAFSLFFNYTFAQEESNCKVLLEAISKSYDGDCKKGLAHGKGVAKGVDTYEGKFKKGLPNGQGKYIWANGDYYKGNWKDGKKNGTGYLYTASEDKGVKGIWKDDKFVKEIVDPPYKVYSQTGIQGYSFYKDDIKPYKIEVVFQRDGRQTKTIDNDLRLTSSSGAIKTSSGFTGFEYVEFPFEGSIRFVTMNRFNSSNVVCEMKFKITEAASWRIVIKY